MSDRLYPTVDEEREVERLRRALDLNRFFGWTPCQEIVADTATVEDFKRRRGMGGTAIQADHE